MDDNADLDPDVAVENLLVYADKLGVRLHGIAPQRLPGRGFGIVATRALRPGDVVLEVPTPALRTATTVPAAVRRLAGTASVHGLLAADLWMDGGSDAVPQTLSYGPQTSAYAPWNAVLPTRADLAAGMPLLWPAELQALLPSAARAALAKQRAKLDKDWAALNVVVDDDAEMAATSAAKTAYTQAWLLVNSRTFYYTTRRTEAARPPPHPDDCMAMQPVADLFNHAADGGCRVAYAAAGFSFAADRAYTPGDELPISYGAHGNDALLVEYGFLLAGNRWDEVALDDVVRPRLTRAARADLDAAGFSPSSSSGSSGSSGSSYVVDAATPGGCYRTQVALRRVLCGSDGRRVAAWRRFVEGGEGDGGQDDDRDQEAVDALMLVCLDEMVALARDRLAALRRLGGGDEEEEDDGNKRRRLRRRPGDSREDPVGSSAQRRLLAQRWREIEATVVRAAEQLRAAKGAS